MKETDPSLELRGLVPPDPLLPHPGVPVWAWFAMAAGVLLLALIGIILLRVLTRKRMVAPGSPREAFYRQAVAALQAISSARIQEVATQVSVILRRYLAGVVADPALYETHEEFISRHEALAKYPEELRRQTAEAFSRIARLKYGREVTGDPQPLTAEARDLLDRLHQNAPAA